MALVKTYLMDVQESAWNWLHENKSTATLAGVMEYVAHKFNVTPANISWIVKDVWNEFREENNSSMIY